MINCQAGIEFTASWPTTRKSVQLFGWEAYERWASLGDVHLGGFGIGRRRDVPFAKGKFGSVYATQTGETVFATIPTWFPFATGIASVFFWRRSRRRPFAPEGHCAACGYDLRASKDRCPECGAAIKTTLPGANAV